MRNLPSYVSWSSLSAVAVLEADVLLFNQNGLHNAVCSWKHQVVACAHGIYIFVCLVLYIYGFENKNQKNTRQIVDHLL